MTRTNLRFLLVACSLALSTVAVAYDEGSQGPGSKPDDLLIDLPHQKAGLKLSIDSISADKSDDVRIRIEFENVGQQDFVLNLGEMLGNGKVQLPGAIGLKLLDEAGKSRELKFSDKSFPGVAGRVDDYLVPLRAGSTYSLTVKLQNFWCPETKESSIELTPQTYQVRASFTGQQAVNLNSDTEGLKFLPFWTGELTSPAASFDIK